MARYRVRHWLMTQRVVQTNRTTETHWRRQRNWTNRIFHLFYFFGILEWISENFNSIFCLADSKIVTTLFLLNIKLNRNDLFSLIAYRLRPSKWPLLGTIHHPTCIISEKACRLGTNGASWAHTAHRWPLQLERWGPRTLETAAKLSGYNFGWKFKFGGMKKNDKIRICRYTQTDMACLL